MYRYDDSEASPNRDGASMFLAYRSIMPLQTDTTISFNHLFPIYQVPGTEKVLNFAVLPYEYSFRAK